MQKTILSIACLALGILANAQAPKFEWVKQIGGTLDNFGTSIAVDASGNVYTTGYFYGTTDFDPGIGIYNLTASGSNIDIFISKLDASGNFMWAKNMGGNEHDYGLSIAADLSGNVYTTGFFQGTVDFDPGSGTSNLTSIGYTDIFISKLDASGNFAWAKNIGGDFYDDGRSIAVDRKGNVYMTGRFKSVVDFNPNAGVFNLTSNGGDDIFISKLDSSGNFVWAKSVGGTSTDIGCSIVTDRFYNVYVSGYFSGMADFDPSANTLNLTSKGYNDIFVLKLDEAGNLVWAKSTGGVDNDYAYSIAVDTFGNTYTTGSFLNTIDFDPGIGVSNLNSNGVEDIFILKLDKAGNFVWARQMGGTQNDEGHSIALDPSGNVYIAGWFNDIMDFDLGAGVFNLTPAGEADIFVSKLDTSGNFVWAKRMGGASSDYAYSITADAKDNIYTTGSFIGTADFDSDSSGSIKLTSYGKEDVFLHKISQCVPIDVTIAVVDTVIKANQAGASYQWIDCNTDKAIAGETNQTLQPKTNGKYAVIVSLKNCSDTSVCIIVTHLDIERNNYQNSPLVIYPNPTNGLFNIHFSNPSDNTSIEVYNSLGILVYRQTGMDEKNEIDLRGKANGLYIVRVMKDDHFIGIQKIIKN